MSSEIDTLCIEDSFHYVLCTVMIAFIFEVAYEFICPDKLTFSGICCWREFLITYKFQLRTKDTQLYMMINYLIDVVAVDTYWREYANSWTCISCATWIFPGTLSSMGSTHVVTLQSFQSLPKQILEKDYA